MDVLEEIDKRRALLDQLEASILEHADLPHTLLDMLEMLWRQTEEQGVDRRKAAGEQLVLPNGRKLRKGGLKVSWGDFLSSIQQLKAYLTLMLPPSTLNTRSWLMKEPPFLPPPNPNTTSTFTDQARKKIQNERLAPFVAPVRPDLSKAQRSAVAPNLLRVPEKPVVTLPHFSSLNCKRLEKQAERRRMEVRKGLQGMIGEEIDVKKRWLKSFRSIGWDMYSFEELLNCKEQREMQEEAVRQIPLEMKLTPIPVFVEPDEEVCVDRVEDVFQPPELESLPQPINVNDIVLTKPEIGGWNRDIRVNFLQSLLRDEVSEAKRFRQIGRLRIQCASKWKTPAELYSEEGRVVLLLPFTREVQVHCTEPKDNCYHVQLICFTPSVELTVKEKHINRFTIRVDSEAEAKSVGNNVVIFRWRILSSAWLQHGIYSPQESGRWTPQRALVPRPSSKFWVQLPYPRLKRSPLKQSKMQDVLDGDGIIDFAGLQLMKPCNPPYEVASTVAYSGYKALLVLCLSKKTQITQTIKGLLLQLLQPRQTALVQLFGRGGGLNVAIVGAGKGTRFYSEDGFLATQAKSIESMRSWVRLQTVAHNGKCLSVRKDIDTVVKWAAAKRTTAVHFLTADFKPEDYSVGVKTPPFHVLCFGNRPERKEVDLHGGTIEYIAVGKTMHCLDEMLNLSNAKWSSDTTREAMANELYRRQHITQENIIRLENRRALRQATSRFQALYGEASQAEEAIVHQDALRAVIWHWQSIADVALLRARTTIMNLFLAAATVRKKQIVRQKRTKLEEDRTEAVAIATEAVVHILDTVLLDVYSRLEGQFKSEHTRIEKRNEELVRIAREEFDSRMDPVILDLDIQRQRREHMKRRDDLFREHLRKVDRIKAKNAVVEKERKEQMEKAKFNMAIPQIHQLLNALARKDETVNCLLHKFRIMGRPHRRQLKTPANLAKIKGFMPILSHESYRKNIPAAVTLQAQTLERELHRLLTKQDAYLKQCLSLVDNLLESEQKEYAAKRNNEISIKLQQFERTTAEAREQVTSTMESITTEHGRIAFTGWKIAPRLPLTQELKGCQHIDSALRRRKKAVAMLQVLESIHAFQESLKSGNLHSSSGDSLPQCVSEKDFSIPLNIAAFNTLLAKASNSAISAVKASAVLESADESAFALAEAEREKLRLEAWYEVEVFPLTFENKARLLLYELELEKTSKKYAVEYKQMVAVAKKAYEENAREIQRRHEALLKSCEERDCEAERLAKEDYKALLIKAHSDFRHCIVEPIRLYNTDMRSAQKRAEAARKELTLVERFENELTYSVPKTKLARKVAECTVREALQRAFKPHVAGSALHAVNTKDLPKPFTLFA